MNKSNKFSPEARERAVRMVQEHRGEYPSLSAAVESIAPKIGCMPPLLFMMAEPITWVELTAIYDEAKQPNWKEWEHVAKVTCLA